MVEYDEFREFLIDKGVSPGSARNYISALRVMQDIFAGRNLVDVPYEEIVDGLRSRGYSRATALSRSAALRRWYDFLGEDKDRINERLVGRDGFPAPQPLTQVEEERFEELIEKGPYHRKEPYIAARAIAAMSIFYRSRMRVLKGDLLNLNVEDLSIGRVENNLRIQLPTGNFDVDAGCREGAAFDEYLPLRQTYLLRHGRYTASQHALFINKFGKRLGVKGLFRAIQRYTRNEVNAQDLVKGKILRES